MCKDTEARKKWIGPLYQSDTKKPDGDMETDMGKITADHVNTLDLCKRLKLICLIFLKCYSGVVMSS